MPDPEITSGGNGVSDSTGFVDSVVTLAERLLEIGVEDALVMTGYDDCAIGILERFGMEPIVLYDKELVIQKLLDGGISTYEEALEFYEFNQLGGWHGDKTPGFLVRLSDAE
tara:strand:- start:150 stop:485 length:336 start_codon:yes stop_codon:yes gene_type:complete